MSGKVEQNIMEKTSLKANPRDVLGRKTNQGRRQGLIPAVVYGRGVESANLWVNALDFSRFIKKSGESTMFSLEIDGKNDRNVIIYDIQRDPVTDKVIHIDFFQVRMDEKIETEVELEYIGQSPAVVELGGILVKNLDEIEVKCFPADLPSKIEVDISILKTFEDYIYVKDLKISNRVEIGLEPETVVALVSQPRTEEELAGLSGKVEEDVSKVEGVVKEAPKEDDMDNKK